MYTLYIKDPKMKIGLTMYIFLGLEINVQKEFFRIFKNVTFLPIHDNQNFLEQMYSYDVANNIPL